MFFIGKWDFIGRGQSELGSSSKKNRYNSNHVLNLFKIEGDASKRSFTIANL